MLRRGWLTSGPECQALREDLSEFLSVPAARIVLASSATAGLQAVLDLLHARHPKCHSMCRPIVKIAEGTWPGMHHAIQHAGCFVFLETYDRKPDVRVLTDIGGRRSIDPIQDIQGTVYIHDACHSWMPDPAAAFGLVSFYPTKLVPGAEGGAVICREAADAEELASWLYCGLVPGSAGQGHQPTRVGRKANMTDVTAALNREALELAPTHIRATGEAWLQLADAAFRRDIPYRYQNERPYLFQVEVPTQDDVQPLRAGLEALGVPSAWNFRPSPLVTIPCLPGTTRSQAKDLMDKVKECL